MRNTSSLSSWVHFPFHSRGLNRNRSGQFLPRYCTSRHLLRSCPLPLRLIYGCSLCYHCWLRSLIPPVFRIHPSQHLNKSTLWHYVPGRKPYLLPPTFPWSSWHASAVLRLPGCVYSLKHSVLYWLNDLPCGRNPIPLHHLRSIRRQT